MRIEAPRGTSRDRESKAVHAHDYRRSKCLVWNNDYSRRFQTLLGDQALHCAFDPTINRWVFGQLTTRTVSAGVDELSDFSDTFVVIWGTLDSSRFEESSHYVQPTYVDINDPRVMPWLMKCSLQRNPRERGWQKAMLRGLRDKKERAEAKALDEVRNLAKEMYPRWKKEVADPLGIPTWGHRGTANDGAAIWSRPGERSHDPSRPEPVQAGRCRVLGEQPALGSYTVTDRRRRDAREAA